MSHQTQRVPVHFPATANTVYRGERKYETNLDVACDLAALKAGELDERETVSLVDYLTTMVYEGRTDATS
jgi:hypothetical protein